MNIERRAEARWQEPHEEEMARVRYREGQIITKDDLLREQRSKLEARRKHNLALHGVGIATGLVPRLVDETIEISPGVAVDGYGREIVVGKPHRFERAGLREASKRAKGATMAVWLLYGRRAVGELQGADRHCGTKQNNRWHEAACFALTVSRAAKLETLWIEEVPPGALARHRTLEPSDNPKDVWPIFLGRISETREMAWAIDLRGRHYIAVRASLVRDPLDRACIRIAPPGNRRQFLVSVEDKEKKDRPRLSIERSAVYAHCASARSHGATAYTKIWGGATVGNNAILLSNGPGLRRRHVELGRLEEEPTEPRAWQIYRVKHQPQPPPGQPLEADAEETKIEQLRFEIRDPGNDGDRSQFQLAIGYRSNGAFVPCMTAAADRSVDIHGRLFVEGQLIRGPIQADLRDPIFLEAVTTAWAQGVTTALTLPGWLQLSVVKFEIQSAESLSFRVDVSNTGSAALSPVELYATVSGTVDQELTVSQSIATLAPGEARSFTQDLYPKVSSGQLVLTVVGAGIGPGGARSVATIQESRDYVE